MEDDQEWRNVNIYLQVEEPRGQIRPIFVVDFKSTRPFRAEIVIINIPHQEIYRYLCKNCLTDLNLAALTNNTKILTEIISCNVNLNIVDRIGSSALHYAARFGSINAMRLLLMHPKILMNIKDNDGNTPLFIAINYFINIEIIKTLIDAGVEVNNVNNYKETALFCVIMNFNMSFEEKFIVAKMLLEHGADPNIDRDYSNRNILGKLLVLNRAYGEEELKDFMNLICLLLSYGADVCGNYYDFAPYAYALMHCQHQITELLYDYVADFNHTCYINGVKTSLFLVAVSMQNEQVFKMIRDGADINFCNRYTTCLLESVGCKDSELYKYIWFNCDRMKSISKLIKIKNIHHNVGFIHFFVAKCKFPRDQFIEALYLLFDCEYAVTQLREEGIASIYWALFEKFKSLQIPKEDRVKILYMFLPHVETLCYDHLILFFKEYGFNEEFETFLKVNVKLKHFHYLSHYLTRICYPSHGSIGYMYDVCTPPSLLELSRDAIRKTLQHQYLMDSSEYYFGYYNKVQKLDVPQCIKDIICLKRLITYVKKLEFEDETITLVLKW